MTDEKKEKKPVKPKKAEVVKPSKSKGADPKQPQPNTVCWYRPAICFPVPAAL